MAQYHATKDFDLELISTVRKYSIIYVPEHPDYRSSKKRHEIWEKIGNELHIDPVVCRKRWGWMKTNFVKYTLGIQEGNTNRRKALPYYDRLRVLFEKGVTGDDFSKNISNSNTTNSDDTTHYSQVCSSTFEHDAYMEISNDEEINAGEKDRMLNAKLENIDLTIEEDDSLLDLKSDDIVIDNMTPTQSTTTGHDNSALSYSVQSQVTSNRIIYNESEMVYEDVSTTQPPQPLPPQQQQQQQQVQRSHNYNNYTNAILEEDECLIAGKRIGFQLKSVEDFQRTIAEKLISDIVYFAKMGNLTENSTVNCNRNNSH